MPTTFDVLAEPHRRRILDLLRTGECAVGQLIDALGVSQPAVSKHLRVLRDAGLVDVRVDAQRRLYRLRPEPLVEVDAWLAPYRHLWADARGRLEAHRPARTVRRRAVQTDLWGAYYRRRNPTAIDPSQQRFPVAVPAALAH